MSRVNITVIVILISAVCIASISNLALSAVGKRGELFAGLYAVQLLRKFGEQGRMRGMPELVKEDVMKCIARIQLGKLDNHDKGILDAYADRLIRKKTTSAEENKEPLASIFAKMSATMPSGDDMQVLNTACPKEASTIENYIRQHP